MAKRKSGSPQKAALPEMMENCMKDKNVKVKDGSDVDSIKLFVLNRRRND